MEQRNLPPVRSVGFWEAIRLAFQQYATFSGRATRKEYWYFCLLNGAVSVLLMLLLKLELPVILWIERVYTWGTLIPGIALCIRRLHDTGKSGKSLLWVLVPLVGGFVLLAQVCRDSADDNQYGPRKIDTMAQEM